MTTAKTRQRLVIGNWKMNGSLAANEVLLKGIRDGVENTGAHNHCIIAVCPSFPYLAQVSQVLAGSSVSWGAQDVSWQESGAFTGEVSASMLNDFNCAWALVGHSERRALHGETSEQVALKAQAALAHNITPVVCVGETLQDREQEKTLAVIQAQLAPVLALGEQAVNKMVIAYEPVWAIGTGLTASPEQAQEVHAYIRAQLNAIGAGNVQVLYGGSVKAANAASLFAMADIDGALVGGAALVAEEFLNIATA
ncbi:triose-phosphate isomerase [Advenella sp. WQ 585]|uniref:Triosephosphate isomerase n=1 Tax=Advenella mandrilli TaxID=2800330 RepID=A0ABS1E7Z0_9BURK|nr:triose-phosphate isomerase [Advenella mandrilli]MBK1779647.1 triose-phosphate isomerase [Advenella mandrilli]